MTECVCGSQNSFAECCSPFLTRVAKPKTAEALMRSRYTAYATNVVDYIKATSTGVALEEFNLSEAKDFIKEVEFTGLEILHTEKGTENDETGIVEFIFRYKQDGEKHAQHELSSFCRKDGEWFFENSKINPKSDPVRVTKISRNDPCPCGSGKKYKKCCSD